MRYGLLVFFVVLAIVFIISIVAAIFTDRKRWRDGFYIIPIGPYSDFLCRVTPCGDNQAEEASEQLRIALEGNELDKSKMYDFWV